MDDEHETIKQTTEKYLTLDCATSTPLKHLQSDKTRPLTLRDSLIEFYTKHNPDKIESIETLLDQNFFSEKFTKITVTDFFRSYEARYEEAPFIHSLNMQHVSYDL